MEKCSGMKKLERTTNMEVWEKINGKWKKQKFVDFTGLLNKANPSDDRVLVQMTELREFGIKKTESNVRTIDDLLATTRELASERAKVKGHNYIVRIWSDGKTREFKIEDWEEMERDEKGNPLIFQTT